MRRASAAAHAPNSAQHLPIHTPGAPAGFQSLPTTVQHKILALASAHIYTAPALRRVSRSFEAHAWIARRSLTTVHLDGDPDGDPDGVPDGATFLALLPYLPRLTTIVCFNLLSPASVRYADAILTTQLPAWPDLVSLSYFSNYTHFPAFLQQLPAAMRFRSLNLTLEGAAAPRTGFPHTLALALPQLQNLESLKLSCNVLTGCPVPHICEHLSALTRLTQLHFRPADDPDGAATFAAALSSLTALASLRLDCWPSSASADDLSAWRTLLASLHSLRSLDSLHILIWQIDHSSSAAYFSELAPTLTSLRALTHLRLHADLFALQSAPVPGAAGIDSAATAAVVQAIGSLTQLEALELAVLRRVNVAACCQHLAGLTNLTHA